jgi:hypothetical protein
MSEERTDEVLQRRSALKRGAAVLAGVAGLGVAAAAAAPAARADVGDPLLLGQPNDSGPATTVVTNTSLGSTLRLGNAGGGAPLNLTPGDGVTAASTAAGDLASDLAGAGRDFAFPSFTHAGGTVPAVGFLYSDAWCLQPVPIQPQRVLDTRDGSNRSRIVNPAGNFGPDGRLLGGHIITLSLHDLLFGPGAVWANVTVTGSTAGGFVTVFPTDPKPRTSTVNFAAGQTVANFCITGVALGPDGAPGVQITATATTHVVIDVTGFAAPSPFLVAPGIQSVPPAAALSEAQRRAVVARVDAAYGRR